jgi:hypothetical protein
MRRKRSAMLFAVRDAFTIQIYWGKIGRGLLYRSLEIQSSFGQARTFKSVEPKPDLLIHPDVGAKMRPPTALQVVHWITFKEEQRLDWQKAYLARLCQSDQEIAQTDELIQSEIPMLR